MTAARCKEEPDRNDTEWHQADCTLRSAQPHDRHASAAKLRTKWPDEPRCYRKDRKSHLSEPSINRCPKTSR